RAIGRTDEAGVPQHRRPAYGEHRGQKEYGKQGLAADPEIVVPPAGSSWLFIRCGIRLALRRFTGNVAAVIRLELLPVDIVAGQLRIMLFLPVAMELRRRRRLRQVLRPVPAQPVQVEDVLIPQRLSPHPDEADIEPSGQE